jgi:hypothetical protein
VISLDSDSGRSRFSMYGLEGLAFVVDDFSKVRSNRFPNADSGNSKMFGGRPGI